MSGGAADCSAILFRYIFRISVIDTGIGISESDLERVFEAFIQANTTTTRRFAGTGLGLAIAKQLVGLMGGKIGASSVQGQGSVFWFELPLVLVRNWVKADQDEPVVTDDFDALLCESQTRT